jgi:manganese efflux pump family protein
MTTAQFIILGIVIGFNNLAVALALGSLGHNDKRYRIVSVFTAVEFVVPLIGLWVGQAAATHMGTAAVWVGPLLLVAIGVWTIVVSYKGKENEDRLIRQIASYWALILLALVLSADNLIIGFILGLGDVSPLRLALVIALFSGTFTWLGVTLGAKMRRVWENRVTVIAGILLIALGLADAVGWM